MTDDLKSLFAAASPRPWRLSPLRVVADANDHPIAHSEARNMFNDIALIVACVNNYQRLDAENERHKALLSAILKVNGVEEVSDAELLEASNDSEASDDVRNQAKLLLEIRQALEPTK